MLAISAFAEVMGRAFFFLTLPNESRYVKLIILSYQFVRDTLSRCYVKTVKMHFLIQSEREKLVTFFCVSNSHNRTQCGIYRL